MMLRYELKNTGHARFQEESMRFTIGRQAAIALYDLAMDNHPNATIELEVNSVGGNLATVFTCYASTKELDKVHEKCYTWSATKDAWVLTGERVYEVEA